MSNASPQSLKNHARFDPPYHLVLGAIMIANLIIAVVNVVRHFGFLSVWVLVLSLGLVILVLKIRTYPLKVQDRVIRLEERLRLQSLAPAEWHEQIYRLNENQLIGLRFAGDDEVVGLAKMALEENLTRKQIKERIRTWRADNWRI
jgi:Family of unknown function (DUF6526)